jgi:Spy/CpxP family protein refolding chaperone
MIRIFFVLLFWIILSATALGQGPPPPERPEGSREKGMMGGPMHHPTGDRMQRLNFTQEQLTKLQELHEVYLRDTLAWRNELMVKRFALRDLLQNLQADTNQILAKQREISELEAKIQERSLLHLLEMRKVLTPEQIKLLPPSFGPGGLPMQRTRQGWGQGMGRE